MTFLKYSRRGMHCCLHPNNMENLRNVRRKVAKQDSEQEGMNNSAHARISTMKLYLCYAN